MLDIITRMLISAGIFTGATYLPALSEAVSAPTPGAAASAAPVRACPARPVAASGVRSPACVG